MKDKNTTHGNTNGSLPSLKVIGSFHPSTAFALKPRIESGQSITFRVSMWIPSAIWFGLAIILPAGIGIDHQIHPQNYTNSPWLFIVVASFSGFFIMLGLYTVRLWRSIRIERTGQVYFNIPRIIGRNRFTLEHGSVWADEVTRIRSGKKGVHLSVTRNVAERMRNIDRIKAGTPAFVVHDKSRCFLLVHNKVEVIEQYSKLLANEFNLQPSGQEYTINYSGLLDEGWA